MKKQNEPNHEIRLGKIRATIWANSRDDEDVWYRVTTSRLYREDSQWRTTQSFRPEDLPVLGKAIDLAYNWIVREGMAEESPTRKETMEAREANDEGSESYGKQKGKRKQSGGVPTPVRESKGGRKDQSRRRKRGGISASSPRTNGNG
jgi:hypothetical protein